MNEAENLPRLFASLPAGVRTFVVDADSGDATVAIARELGAHVVVRAWEGFVATRRWAQARVGTPWMLMLDADERLDAVARDAILAVEPAPATAAYELCRTTWFCGRPIRGMGWGDERVLRLMRTSRATVVPNPVAGGTADVHECWVVRDGDVLGLPGTLEHVSYPSLASYAQKFGRYTALEAVGLKPSAARLITAVPRAFFRALWLLVVRGGWRDGWRGAFIACASAGYPVAVAWKALRS